MINEKHAKLQETMALWSCPKLMREEEAMAPKEDGLVDVMQRAELLMKYLRFERVIILTQVQAAHFLIAAVELHLRIHEWGKRRDAQKARTTTNSPATASETTLKAS